MRTSDYGVWKGRRQGHLWGPPWGIGARTMLFSERGQAPPQVCGPETELCLWAWAGGLGWAVRALGARWLRRGPPVSAGHLSSGHLSSATARKNNQGASTCLQSLGSLRLPELPLSLLLCSKPGSDRRCPAAYEAQPGASVPCPFCNTDGQPSIVLSYLFSTFKLITAGLLRLQWNTVTKKLVRVKRKKKKKTRNQQTRTSLPRDFSMHKKTVP